MRQLLGKIPYQQHARRHLPGGSDPLPVSGGATWAALWDGYVYGQFFGDSAADGENIKLVWPRGKQADGSTDSFRIDVVADSEYGINVHELTILQSGVYTFSLQIEWDDANVGESTIRYYVHDANNSANFPGQTGGGPGGGGLAHDVVHRSEDYSDFEQMDLATWGPVPIKLDTGEEMLVEVRAIAMNYYPLTPVIDETFGYKRLWVTRHSDLDYDHAGNFPNTLV